MRKRNVILAVLFALLTAGVANAALPKKVSGWYGYNAVATSTVTTSVWYAAPESDPVDVTDKIVNPNFNNGKDGWEGNFGNGAVKATSVNPLITSFGGGFDVHQTITGLTPGCYTLKVQAFAREKSNADIINAVAAGTETYDVQAYIYAGNAEVKVLHIAYNGTDGMPDSSGDAANVFNAGSYDQSLDFVVGSNGTTTIGIKNLSSNSVSYVGYDNFRLYYTGEFEGGIEDIADLGDLPLLTTDESNPILYRINNTRRTAQGKANWWDSFNGITTNKDDAALVYFTGKYVGDNLKVKIHLNESTYTLAGDFTWAVEGIDWYIKEFTSAQGGPYKGVIISNSPDFPNAYGDVTNADGTGCWYVGSSNASPWMYGGQWDGSIFTCEINDPSQIDYVAALISKVPEGKMNADVQAELDNAIAALQADATVKNYEALQALIADAKASIAAYDLVKSTLNGADALNETAKAIFNEKAADIIAAYNNGTLTTDVADTVAAIKAAIAEAAKAGIQEGDDISSLIINGTFDVKGDETGWKVERYDGNNPADFKNGVVTGRGFYRLTQTIEGLPAGTYTLSAQAFTRPMDNGPLAEAIAAGQDIVNEAYIFANGDSVKVHLITDVPEGHAVPNGSGEVATAFADGCYPVSVTVEVGEDGVLTFGFVNWNNVWDNYAGVDNFTLTFDKAAEPTPQPNVEGNLLSEESYNFEGGTTGNWAMTYNNNGGNATATVVEPGYEGSAFAMQLNNTAKADNAYNAQLPINLGGNFVGKYELSFYAKASEEGAEIQFGAQHTPWSADNKEWFAPVTTLTTDWQKYTYEVLLGEDFEAQGGVNTLYINFGNVVGTVQLDRIALVPVPEPEPNPYDYTFESYVGNSYEEYQANVDMAGILADLGAESLNEVNIFAVLGDGTLDPNYQVGNTDGWRNADGMWQSWGADARYCVKADFTLPENQIYYVGGMYEQTKEPATYTATFAFVKKPYVPAPTREEIAQDQGTQYDTFTRATVEYGDGYTEYTVTGDLHVAIKNKGEDGNGIDVTNCEKVVIEFAEPVPAGWKVSYSGVQSPDAWLDVPEGATSYTVQIAGTEYAETGILPEFTLMVGWSGATKEKPLSCKVVGIYKYFIPVGGGEEGNTDGITPTLPEIPVVTNDGEVEEEVCDTVYVNVTLKYVERPDITLNIVGEEDANFTVETFANGYNLPFEGSIDLAAGLEAIGCDANKAEAYAYYTDEEGNPVFVAGAMDTYDGWFYLDGTPKTWGDINASEDDRGIYVKFDPSAANAVTEIGTFPSVTCGYDSTSYTVQWVIANPETGKAYCYNITVTGEAEAVAINSLKNAKQVDWNSAYDLTGRKVATPVKGNIYIVNGKKVLFK
ncbi:MAG: hypothetical protein MJY95_06660 [Bacteroidaceae bacterium]|nr:hypothetical protein [Bacteroidaceae bacterium]